MNIAICDNEKILVDKIAEVINRYCDSYKIQNYVIKRFFSGEELLCTVATEEFDLVFLDIEMDGITGLEVAEKMRKKFPYARIIFVTSYENKVFEAIHYAPFRFVRKRFLETEVQESLQAGISALEHETTQLELRTENGVEMIKSADVFYLMREDRKIKIVTSRQTYATREVLQIYEEKLKNHGFIRCHVGYLVNAKYINRIEKELIIPDNGMDVPLSRHRREDVKKQFQSYIRRV